MIFLGYYYQNQNGYALTVCESSVNPDKVTYHVYDKDSYEEICFSREGAFHRGDAFYAEFKAAEQLYNKMRRPNAGKFVSNFIR